MRLLASLAWRVPRIKERPAIPPAGNLTGSLSIRSDRSLTVAAAAAFKSVSLTGNLTRNSEAYPNLISAGVRNLNFGLPEIQRHMAVWHPINILDSW
jgi:hypothetical protein